VVYAIFPAPDNRFNLECVKRFSHIIGDLEGMNYNGRTVCNLGFGDIKYMDEMMGLASGNCSFPCPYCLISKDTMQSKEDREIHTPRTLKQISDDLHHFIHDLNSDTKLQRLSHNVIKPALIPIDPQNYTIPWLHCLQGIVKTLHKGLLDFMKDTENFNASLVAKLEFFEIRQCPFHGREGTLTGEHCHRYLDNIEAIFEQLTIPVNPFRQLFLHFRNVRDLVGHSRGVSDITIAKAQHSIKLFMDLYRSAGLHVTTKAHIFETHVIPFVQRFGFGLELFGEQGGEHIHHRLNDEKARVRRFGNYTTGAYYHLLLYHLQKVCPTIVSHV
jgi:hypothetical protein